MMMYTAQNKIVAGSRQILALCVLIAALVAALLLAAGPAHASTTFTVNSTSDDGDLTPGNGECYTGDDLVVQGKECTLRAAIQEANATAGADTINFDIPGTGLNTISPASELPAITGPLTVNGYSQPGAKPNTKAVGSDAVLKIELSGTGAPDADGLVLGASNSTVKGLVINRWSYAGIRIDGPQATGNRIAGNFIGTDASGTQKLGNSVGVRFYYGSNNTVGGATPAERNVISGNGHSGVSIGDGVVVKGNKVSGNYIGTDKSGTGDLGNALYGVNIEGAPGTTIGGATAAERNVISGNDQYGVLISGLEGSKVTGNYIGTDASGTQDLGNSSDGVYVDDGLNNAIGGARAGERNVISGNGSDGVFITGGLSKGNRVMGNYVGTGKNGATSLGNGDDGVRIYGARNNTVGGTTAGARNVISGNADAGVKISDAAAGNKVLGNYLGTDASGAKDLGNGEDGVTIYSAPDNIIGGARAGERNVISGNDRDGVYIEGSGSTGNRITGNYIGTDKNGTAPLGNFAVGVLLSGASNNTIGGTQAGAGNVISANSRDFGYEGLSIYGGTATGNRILSNSIFSNGGLGIDLGADGTTPNDPGDTDTGPNYRQNFPVLSSAKRNATGTTTVRGTLNSTPGKTLTVQLFSNPAGTDEGKKLLGQKSVTTGAGGDVSFSFSTKKKVSIGQAITATATGAEGTSEFSAPKQVVRK